MIVPHHLVLDVPIIGLLGYHASLFFIMTPLSPCFLIHRPLFRHLNIQLERDQRNRSLYLPLLSEERLKIRSVHGRGGSGGFWHIWFFARSKSITLKGYRHKINGHLDQLAIILERQFSQSLLITLKIHLKFVLLVGLNRLPLVDGSQKPPNQFGMAANKSLLHCSRLTDTLIQTWLVRQMLPLNIRTDAREHIDR